jgi:sulfide:quinone oxidoreductase
MDGQASNRPLRVVIAGGGVAGLETLLALSDLGEGRVDLTLVAAEPEFTYTPMVVAEPFAAGHAERRQLEPIARQVGARFIQQALAAVRPERHSVALTGGEELAYDVLVVCVGARSRPAYRRALTFDARGDPFALNGVLADLEGGWSKHVAFIVPPGATWALPIYELALMTQRHGWSMGFDDIRCTIVTPEPAPLAIFGTAASRALADLLAQRGIDVLTASYAREGDDGGFLLAPGDRRLNGARAVALPVPEGPRLEGMPVDADGFFPVDEHSRVRGADDVYAAGDGTNFPIKQGGLGTQQADAAAEHIAARAGAAVEPQPFRPVLRGKLLTAGASLYLRDDAGGGAGLGAASEDYLWWPPHKISGRYLAPWLAHETPRAEPDPAGRPLEVEVALPEEWHEEPMALEPLGTIGIPAQGLGHSAGASRRHAQSLWGSATVPPRDTG